MVSDCDSYPRLQCFPFLLDPVYRRWRTRNPVIIFLVISSSHFSELTPTRIALLVFISLLLAVYIWKFTLCIISAEVIPLFPLLRCLIAQLFAFIMHVLLFLSAILMLLNTILQFDPSTYIFLFGLLLTLAEVQQIMFLFMRSKEHLKQVYTLESRILWAYSGTVFILYLCILITQVPVCMFYSMLISGCNFHQHIPAVLGTISLRLRKLVWQ